MAREMRLTAVILARDEEQNIAQCITSLDWADRVVVILDSRTKDRTEEIARYLGAAVYPRPFRDYADQRNAALRIVRTDWVFFVDADERVSRELAREIRDVMGDESKTGWWVPRHNYIFGRIIRHTGWYPDYQLRLLRKGYARYDPERPVHELVILDGQAGYLRTPLTHYNYHTLAEFKQRQRRYVAYEANALKQKGLHPRWWSPALQTFREFWRRYVLLQGYRDGMHGLVLSVLMAWYAGEQYRLLQGLWRAQD